MRRRGIVRFYTPWQIFYTTFDKYWTGFEREYRETGSAMADMLARGLFLLYLHIVRLLVDGFIAKKDTHFGTFLYQNRCPDMKKVSYFDTSRLG